MIMNEQRLRTFLKERFPDYTDQLTLDDDLASVVDSLGLFDLVGFIETDFNLRIPTAMFSPDRFTTLGRTLAFIAEMQTHPTARKG